MKFCEGDAVMAHYGSVRVGHVLKAGEAEALAAGEHPWSSGDPPDRIEAHPYRIHYYPDCPGARRGLSWSIEDTTCTHCLLARAKALRGWRWAYPGNADEVAYLTKALGARVDGFATGGDDDAPPWAREEDG